MTFLRRDRHGKLARDVALLQSGSLRFGGPRFWRRYRYRSLLASIGRADQAALDRELRGLEARSTPTGISATARRNHGPRSEAGRRERRAA
jgi:hypothetical protein